MSVVSIISATYCRGNEISLLLSEELSYQLAGDELIEMTAREYDIPVQRIHEAIYGNSTFFGMLSKNRRKYLSYFEYVLARRLAEDNIVYYGNGGLLIPKDIAHVLRVCLVADFQYRVKLAADINKVNEKEAQAIIKKDDEMLFNWAGYLTGLNPWDKRLYDIIIPVNENTLGQILDLIKENLNKDILKTTDESRKKMDDFVLAARVQSILTGKKHNIGVKADNGHVTVLIEKYSLRLEHYKDELKKITQGIDGVKSVDVNIGPKFKMPSTYPPVDFEVPKKILLVDDEVDFVQTLSERLQQRKIESRIAYNGEEALLSIEDDQPEVIVLDLKMPGIGGLDVLRKVKKEHPDTEVIILTGHGSDREKELAMELGAFAYLEKPVDINVLSDTMKKAYAKINLDREKGDK